MAAIDFFGIYPRGPVNQAFIGQDSTKLKIVEKKYETHTLKLFLTRRPTVRILFLASLLSSYWNVGFRQTTLALRKRLFFIVKKQTKQREANTPLQITFALIAPADRRLLI
jgi:hypothetical protein